MENIEEISEMLEMAFDQNLVAVKLGSNGGAFVISADEVATELADYEEFALYQEITLDDSELQDYLEQAGVEGESFRVFERQILKHNRRSRFDLLLIPSE